MKSATWFAWWFAGFGTLLGATLSRPFRVKAICGSEKNNMAKRGRKKKAGPRQPNGQLRRAKDYGTPELMEKRMRAVGGGDPVAAACMLTQLGPKGRKVITQDQENAGLRFAALHRKAVGMSLHAKGIAFDDDKRGHYGLDESDFQIERAQQHVAAWREARELVKGDSRQTLDACMNVACYERAPSSPARLLIGLDLLALHFGMTERRKEAA